MNNKITYHKEGDYLIPDLCIKNYSKNDYCIGKYGRLRLNFLKEHKRGFYTDLMLSGTLSEHLASVDTEANKRVNAIIARLADSEGIDENLKQTNQIQWFQAINNIKNRAEEIVLNELIYW